ncbi:hypothetical protein ACFSNO_28450 [Streptomyces cirratus]
MLHSPTEPALTLDTLAHGGAGPLHWVATATAMAAVIAAAGLLQPEPATGTPVTATAAAAAGPPAAAPDAHAVTYPLDCKGVPQAVTATAQGDLDGDDRPETVAAVRCDAGSGTRPARHLRPDPGQGERRPATRRGHLARSRTTPDGHGPHISDRTVTASLLGYSSPAVPRYSPDTRQLAKWRWTGGKFRQELTDSRPGSV